MVSNIPSIPEKSIIKFDQQDAQANLNREKNGSEAGYYFFEEIEEEKKEEFFIDRSDELFASLNSLASINMSLMNMSNPIKKDAKPVKMNK